MGYVVLHMDKSPDNEVPMTAHIARTKMPPNAVPELTYLNEELVEFPEGVADRTEAINHRLEHAGLTRKIGTNQVRVIRVMLTGTQEDMKRIALEGRLKAWCADNLEWLRRTFGAENVVSAVLHMDETTPHIHAAVVPIVTGERRKVRKEKTDEAGKRKYRTKSTARPRLCADDVMSRVKLKEYQDTYAAAMAKYGLQRGIDGSKARHVTTQEFYRNAIARQQNLQDNIGELLRIEEEKLKAVEYATKQEQTARAELHRTAAELNAVKGELKTEKLKNSAAEVGTTILDGIGSMIGTSKVKRQEQEIGVLRQEAAARDETIEILQTKIQTMQSEHSRELTTMQARHTTEKANLTNRHEKEISLLKAIISKATTWFPYFREMIRMESVCRTVGFDDEQTTTLIMGKPLEYSGELYSEEHNYKFAVEQVTAQITPVPTDKRKLQLNIDKVPFKEWCREKFEKLRNAFHSTRGQYGHKRLKI
ncbi:MAG: plasmid recombination protein [Alistipes sp.]|uniref:MobV family relaxase n=1 Tax=Alistipes sp. TaxID=1872444 RepID=UPI0023F14DAE|nr:MobV family relaxase [Alistipes sp.]MBR2219077.1 plasmid recombination protein [Alistipes sp.]